MSKTFKETMIDIYKQAEADLPEGFSGLTIKAYKHKKGRSPQITHWVQVDRNMDRKIQVDLDVREVEDD